MSDFDVIAAALSRIEAHGMLVDQRLVAIEVRQEGTRVELAGINRRLDVGNERMDVANGRMTRAEGQLRDITEEAIRQNARRDGAEDANAATRSRVLALWERVEKPIVYGAGMLVFGVGIRIGAFLLGGVAW